MKNLFLFLLLLSIFSCKKSHDIVSPATPAINQDSLDYYTHLTYLQNIDSLGIVLGKIYTFCRYQDSEQYLFYPVDSPASIWSGTNIGFSHLWPVPKDTIIFNTDSTITEIWHDVSFNRDHSWSNPTFFITYGAAETLHYAVHLAYDTTQQLSVAYHDDDSTFTGLYFDDYSFYSIVPDFKSHQAIYRHLNRVYVNYSYFDL